MKPIDETEGGLRLIAVPGCDDDFPLWLRIPHAHQRAEAGTRRGPGFCVAPADRQDADHDALGQRATNEPLLILGLPHGLPGQGPSEMFGVSRNSIAVSEVMPLPRIFS